MTMFLTSNKHVGGPASGMPQHLQSQDSCDPTLLWVAYIIGAVLALLGMVLLSRASIYHFVTYYVQTVTHSLHTDVTD